MPEIKHDFTAGKMNKDLDERLVPNGEYRDAVNIQVRTTDGGGDGVGNSGTAQNLQGNVSRGSGHSRGPINRSLGCFGEPLGSSGALTWPVDRDFENCLDALGRRQGRWIVIPKSLGRRQAR